MRLVLVYALLGVVLIVPDSSPSKLPIAAQSSKLGSHSLMDTRTNWYPTVASWGGVFLREN